MLLCCILFANPYMVHQVYLDAQSSGTMLFGVPYIELNSQAYAALRGYESVRDKSKLSFLYRVGTGEETPPGTQLDLTRNSTISLNGGNIFGTDTGLDADLTTMPTGGVVGKESWVVPFVVPNANRPACSGSVYRTCALATGLVHGRGSTRGEKCIDVEKGTCAWGEDVCVGCARMRVAVVGSQVLSDEAVLGSSRLAVRAQAGGHHHPKDWAEVSAP